MKAVDQLKDESMAVRLGGIYSLEKIMNSPDKEVKDYHDTIIEMLCAYVREKRPFDQDGYNKELEFFKKENSDPAVENYYSEYEKFIKSLNKYKIPIHTDIRAILTVLGRRKNKDNEEVEIDLKVTNWIKAGLGEMKLEGFNLSVAHLENANLWGAHLENANLDGAHFENAELIEAHLENAKFWGAHFENADLRFAHLENADLYEAHFENADLEHAHFKKANLYGAYLENTNLRFASLENIIIVPSWEDREETKEDRINFINELEKAEQVKEIELDDKIMKIIEEEEEFSELLRRINEGEE